MRYNAVLTAAVLAGSVYGDAQAVLNDAAASASSVASEAASTVSSAVESATASSKHVLPTFTPTTVKGDFVEQFTDDWESRWKISHAKKDSKAAGAKEDEEWAYVGEWAVEEPKVYKGMVGEQGLVVKNAGAHHAISAKFPKVIDNKGKTLVVQYEVKLQNGLECGGAYMKLLRDNKALHADEFSNASPYVIMFGPDKCGSTNKVHFIVNHKNPVSGKYEEKHLMSPPSANVVKTTELYTLIVHPNNTYAILRNNNNVKEGSLLTDFAPSFEPEKEIDDPKDTKPADWVEEAKIADPAAKKPEDWDEDQPLQIVDEEATMPDDWLVDEPLTIPDPEAVKPEDWDDEEDGDFIAPTIPNPKGETAAGLGPWTKPMKKNPLYKGKWTAALVDNPAYKGVWAPKRISNPDYFEVKDPSNLEPMGAIGFEIWTMQSDIMFDNIYIGHSIEEAKKLAEETWVEKHPFEELAELDEKPAEDKKKAPKGPNDLVFSEDPLFYIREKYQLFVAIAKTDPIQAIKFVPEAAAALGVAFVLLLTVLASFVGLIGGSAPAPPPQVKKAVKDANDKAQDVREQIVDAAASGVESANVEVNKRKTAATQ